MAPLKPVAIHDNIVVIADRGITEYSDGYCIIQPSVFIRGSKQAGL